MVGYSCSPTATPKYGLVVNAGCPPGVELVSPAKWYRSLASNRVLSELLSAAAFALQIKCVDKLVG